MPPQKLTEFTVALPTLPVFSKDNNIVSLWDLLWLILVITFQKELKSTDPTMQQSMISAIGALRFDLIPRLASLAIVSLTQMFEKKVS